MNYVFKTEKWVRAGLNFAFMKDVIMLRCSGTEFSRIRISAGGMNTSTPCCEMMCRCSGTEFSRIFRWRSEHQHIVLRLRDINCVTAEGFNVHAIDAKIKVTVITIVTGVWN
jgi:hypothetical protein